MTDDNPSGTLRVLVVDDQADSADSLRLVMELMGHEALATYSGPSALAIAAEFKPQVIFTDVQMPRMGGVELARRLRELPGLENVVIVAATATNISDDRLAGHETLFEAWLHKPYGLAELEALMTRFLFLSRG